MLSVEDALARLTKIEEDEKADPEQAHVQAEEVLLLCVDPRIREKWAAVEANIGFWYA